MTELDRMAAQVHRRNLAVDLALIVVIGAAVAGLLLGLFASAGEMDRYVAIGVLTAVGAATLVGTALRVFAALWLGGGITAPSGVVGGHVNGAVDCRRDWGA